MSRPSLAARRLHSQRLAGAPLRRPEEVVRWLGAVQSQEHAAALWSLGQRTRGATIAAVARAFDEGRFLRTHVLRPTWHFVSPEDLRWMLALTAPRVSPKSAHRRRQLDLDAGTVSRGLAGIERALRGGVQLTRVALGERIGFVRERAAHLMIEAELRGLVCSGAMQGAQHTYALLEDRVPAAPALDRDAALAELVVRYFTSHGPSTVKDLCWWASLTVVDVRRGLEAAGDRLVAEEIDGVVHWSGDRRRVTALPSPTVHLLQTYDEYIVGYAGGLGPERPMFSHVFTVDGRPAGRWKRTIDRRGVRIEILPRARLTRAERAALDAAAAAHGAFLGVQATVTIRAR